ncbi:MAG TPA: hypothetical protein VGU25_01020 [Acidobacteriaceae bacterium]|nr:hypothetical protein [Acidobacteriaceae bacterium]
MTDPQSRWVHRVARRVFDLDRRAAESDLRRLRRDVMHQYSFLFKEHGGRIMPQLSQGVPNLDWATLVVEVNRIYLRASDDGGRTEWHVSLNHILGPWYRLDQILKKISRSTNQPCNSDHDALRYHLPEIERVLRTGA